MAGSSTNFDSALSYINQYLEAKASWLDGSKPQGWFTSGATDMDALLDAFDPQDEDALAHQAYQQAKTPSSGIPVNREMKHRLRVHFLAAAMQTVRKQYLAGAENGYRTIHDSYRYEMANARAVQGCMKKFSVVNKNLDSTEKT